MKRILTLTAAAALALAGFGVARAEPPPAPIGLNLPDTPIVLSLPPGDGAGPHAGAECQFAAASGGGVLAMPLGYGGGVVVCR